MHDDALGRMSSSCEGASPTAADGRPSVSVWGSYAEIVTGRGLRDARCNVPMLT